MMSDLVHKITRRAYVISSRSRFSFGDSLSLFFSFFVCFVFLFLTTTLLSRLQHPPFFYLASK